MFPVNCDYIRRISFASRLFPKLKSAYKLDISKLKSTDKFDGEIFCGGRSKNKDLLTFFGCIASDKTNDLANFIQLPIFRRSLKKLINIVELELENINAQEVLMPTLIPQKLWLQSKRLDRQKDALASVFKSSDNNNNPILLGPTFEETITKLLADMEPISETELPILLYQTSNKFRNEPTPRFGLLRSHEFFMNDLYTFDSNLENANKTYDTITEIYHKIFKHLGLCNKIKRISSDSGNIGGKYSHEYQLPVSSGEDLITECNMCNYAYNNELAKKGNDSNGNMVCCIKCGSSDINQQRAIELGHTFLLSDIYSKYFNAKFATSNDDDKTRYFEMGCYGLGLTRIIGAGLDLLSIIPKEKSYDENQQKISSNTIQIRWLNNIEPFKLGVVVPAKRSKQFNNGSSEYIEKLVNRILATTKNIDIIVEDRDKGGIDKRLSRLQSIGIPNIIVIGRSFLDEQPKVEFLQLDNDKKHYETKFYVEDEVCDYIKSELDI